ncbi:MAG: T9SS type A sorting domain-containing protein, partial [Bacteroidetes bacterium]|nr:T9SS type A sorting domain-containing protein [Bacteroidota bacterium]
LAKAPNSDAGIDSIQSPTTNFCGGWKPVKVKLKNYGNDTLKAVTITWSVNGKLQPAYKWTGNIAKNNAASVTIGNYSFNTGQVKIKVWVVYPNNANDLNTANDTVISTLNVLTTPSAITGGSKTVCSYAPLSLGASAVSGHNYSWTSTPSGFTSTLANPTVTPTTNTTYFLTESFTSGGCSRRDSAIITVKEGAPAYVGKYRAICTGDSTQLGATSITGHTYSWLASSGWTSTKSNPYVTPIAKRLYTLTEKVTSTGCTKSDTVTINLKPIPTRPSTASNNGSLCTGSTLNLTCSSVSGVTSYLWDGPNSFTSTQQNPSITNVALVNAGQYGAMTVLNGCVSTHRYTTVTVNTSPTPNAGSNATFCNGGSTTLGATAVSGHTYSWSPKTALSSSTSANPTANPTATTTYTVTDKITSGGCSKTASVTVTVNPLPSATVVAAATICGGTTKSLGGSSVSGNTYSWSSSPTGFTSTVANPTATVNATTSYSLTEKITATGCAKTNTVKITTKSCPSPPPGKDDDTTNTTTAIDELNTFGFGINIYPNPFTNTTNFKLELNRPNHISIIVYDIYGKVVSEITNTQYDAGEYTLPFNLEKEHCAAGMYFAKIMVGEKLITRKIIRL